MTDIPKCTSRWGHSFEARYSYDNAGDVSLGSFRGGADQYEQMVRALQNKTYERDICVRCGLTVERHPAQKPPETQA